MGAAPNGARIPLAFDTETSLIRPALYAPPLVCVTSQRLGEDARIEHHTTAEATVQGWLEDPSLIIIGHNVAYDMGVLAERYPALRALIFKAYDEDRVTDTQIRQQLLDIAAGIYRRKHLGKGVFVKQEYNLEALAKRCAGMELQKDAWRMSYAEFLDVPMSGWDARAVEVQADARERVIELRRQLGEWQDAGVRSDDASCKALEKEIKGLDDMIASHPSQCRTYPLDDARATLAVYMAQEKHAVPYLADQYRQARAAFALHLSSAWGVRTDEAGVEILRKEVSADLEDAEETLREAGIVRPNGTRDTKAAKARMIEVCRADKRPIPRTDGHAEQGKCKKADGTKVPDGDDACEEHVSLDGDSCEVSDDDILIAYAELSTLKKVLSNDVEALSKGTMWPVHTRYGLAETGRTTSSKPPLQNWARTRKCKACDGKGKAA